MSQLKFDTEVDELVVVGLGHIDGSHLTPAQQIKKQWTDVRAEVANVCKLFHTFAEMYTAEEIDGNKKKKIPPRTDLQLQRQLYRNEAIRLTYQQIAILQKCYVVTDGKKHFHKEWLE